MLQTRDQEGDQEGVQGEASSGLNTDLVETRRRPDDVRPQAQQAGVQTRDRRATAVHVHRKLMSLD